MNLNEASYWLLIINSLDYLKRLKLLVNLVCLLQHTPSLSSLQTFRLLQTLDFSYDPFDDSLIPSVLFTLPHLNFLNLKYGNFQGPIGKFSILKEYLLFSPSKKPIGYLLFLQTFKIYYNILLKIKILIID